MNLKTIKYGWTALDLAHANGHTEAVEVLLKAGMVECVCLCEWVLLWGYNFMALMLCCLT